METRILTRAIQKIEGRYADVLGCLPANSEDGMWRTDTLALTWQALQNRACIKGMDEIAVRLRVMRQLIFYRLYHIDCQQGGSLSAVMQGMTDLAEFCIATAAQYTHTELTVQHGEPTERLCVVGMGKLGGRELNVSSDIDLIFLYAKDGETVTTVSTQTSISHQTFFTEQVRRMHRLLGDVTEHGFVFRVDLALRPYGGDGALAMSMPTLAQYFQRSGREWERFAWLKSRLLATPVQDPAALLALRAIVRSFVFRRFLDHKVFGALRGLHQLIRQTAESKLGRTGAAEDVKLGRGGIREIEFAAQVQQIVRGGRQPELLARPTMLALQRLAQAGLMPPDTVDRLSVAYDFLRRTEHRIQYLDDQQTHALPRTEADRAWLASAMGFDNHASFIAALNAHRDFVAQMFEDWLAAGAAPKRPTVTLEDLQAKAKWTISYVRKHPDVADELQRTDLLGTRFDADSFKAKVRAQYAALQATGLCDEESVLDLLRRAHHIEVFRILVRDVQGLLSVRDVGDELSSLADSLLALAIPWCWAQVCAKSEFAGRGAPIQDHFAVVAYGKLGGKELGYGSDLDVVFLYDAEHPAAKHDESAQRYINLVRKLTTWLTVKTGEGMLFEVDTALRPNGNSGLLVTSIKSYEKYQLQIGSNTAWTWELQAMTRARCVFGSAALTAQFDSVRQQVLTYPRDSVQLASDIVAMRQKLYAAYPALQGQFDIKHGKGGMMDAEFAVQYLVLTEAAKHPDLLANTGNIALLRVAEAQGLLTSGAGSRAADAYQALRDKQHAARLQEVKAVLAVLPNAELLTERQAIDALWLSVFGA